MSDHPNDSQPRSAELLAKLRALGDEKSQGLDPYWKWGFCSGWNAALDADPTRTQGADDARPVATSWPVPLEMNQGHVLEHAVELRFESEEDSAEFVRLYGEQMGERVATHNTATRAQAPDSAA